MSKYRCLLIFAVTQAVTTFESPLSLVISKDFAQPTSNNEPVEWHGLNKIDAVSPEESQADKFTQDYAYEDADEPDSEDFEPLPFNLNDYNNNEVNLNDYDSTKQYVDVHQSSDYPWRDFTPNIPLTSHFIVAPLKKDAFDDTSMDREINPAGEYPATRLSEGRENPATRLSQGLGNADEGTIDILDRSRRNEPNSVDFADKADCSEDVQLADYTPWEAKGHSRSKKLSSQKVRKRSHLNTPRKRRNQLYILARRHYTNEYSKALEGIPQEDKEVAAETKPSNLQETGQEALKPKSRLSRIQRLINEYNRRQNDLVGYLPVAPVMGKRQRFDKSSGELRQHKTFSSIRDRYKHLMRMVQEYNLKHDDKFEPGPTIYQSRHIRTSDKNLTHLYTRFERADTTQAQLNFIKPSTRQQTVTSNQKPQSLSMESIRQKMAHLEDLVNIYSKHHPGKVFSKRIQTEGTPTLLKNSKKSNAIIRRRLSQLRALIDQYQQNHEPNTPDQNVGDTDMATETTNDINDNEIGKRFADLVNLVERHQPINPHLYFDARQGRAGGWQTSQYASHVHQALKQAARQQTNRYDTTPNEPPSQQHSNWQWTQKQSSQPERQDLGDHSPKRPISYGKLIGREIQQPPNWSWKHNQQGVPIRYRSLFGKRCSPDPTLPLPPSMRRSARSKRNNLNFLTPSYKLKFQPTNLKQLLSPNRWANPQYMLQVAASAPSVSDHLQSEDNPFSRSLTMEEIGDLNNHDIPWLGSGIPLGKRNFSVANLVVARPQHLSMISQKDEKRSFQFQNDSPEKRVNNYKQPTNFQRVPLSGWLTALGISLPTRYMNPEPRVEVELEADSPLGDLQIFDEQPRELINVSKLQQNKRFPLSGWLAAVTKRELSGLEYRSLMDAIKTSNMSHQTKRDDSGSTSHNHDSLLVDNLQPQNFRSSSTRTDKWTNIQLPNLSLRYDPEFMPLNKVKAIPEDSPGIPGPEMSSRIAQLLKTTSGQLDNLTVEPDTKSNQKPMNYRVLLRRYPVLTTLRYQMGTPEMKKKNNYVSRLDKIRLLKLLNMQSTQPELDSELDGLRNELSILDKVQLNRNILRRTFGKRTRCNGKNCHTSADINRHQEIKDRLDRMARLRVLMAIVGKRTSRHMTSTGPSQPLRISKDRSMSKDTVENKRDAWRHSSVPWFRKLFDDKRHTSTDINHMTVGKSIYPVTDEQRALMRRLSMLRHFGKREHSAEEHMNAFNERRIPVDAQNALGNGADLFGYIHVPIDIDDRKKSHDVITENLLRKMVPAEYNYTKNINWLKSNYIWTRFGKRSRLYRHLLQVPATGDDYQHSDANDPLIFIQGEKNNNLSLTPQSNARLTRALNWHRQRQYLRLTGYKKRIYRKESSGSGSKNYQERPAEGYPQTEMLDEKRSSDIDGRQIALLTNGNKEYNVVPEEDLPTEIIEAPSSFNANLNQIMRRLNQLAAVNQYSRRPPSKYRKHLVSGIGSSLGSRLRLEKRFLNARFNTRLHKTWQAQQKPVQQKLGLTANGGGAGAQGDDTLLQKAANQMNAAYHVTEAIDNIVDKNYM